MQQPHPGSRFTCAQPAGTAGQLLSISSVQAAQRMGSGATTGDDLTEAKTARAAAAATRVSFSCNPGIFSAPPVDLSGGPLLFFSKGISPNQQYLYGRLASSGVND